MKITSAINKIIIQKCVRHGFSVFIRLWVSKMSVQNSTDPLEEDFLVYVGFIGKIAYVNEKLCIYTIR